MSYIIKPGEEPEDIKKRINILFEKLDAAYPDKCIIGLHSEHKKWGETVTDLYRKLGYPDGKSFLEAYGYKYENKVQSGGRPSSTDADEIISFFKEKYPNGSPFNKAEELFNDCPEYASKYKTLSNQASSIFGMPLGKYLLSIGLIQKKNSSDVAKEKAKKYIICKVKKMLTDKVFYCLSDTKSIKSDDYVEITDDNENITTIVLETMVCTEETLPCPYEELKLINRIIGKREVNGIYGNISFSDDGKTVTSVKSTSYDAIIKIPSGVEIIEDNALLRAKFGTLILPKELKYLGEYTLKNEYGELKKINEIKVEDGNEYFISDEYGFYSIKDNKRKLELFTNKEVEIFEVPNYVNSFADDAFTNAERLKTIILSNSMEEYNEYAIFGNESINEIRISASVKNFIPMTSEYSEGYDTDTINRVYYAIDENNENIFIDGDSIYQILPDHTFKLIRCLYNGKGNITIREETSIIGDYAFCNHRNLNKIEIPNNINEIGQYAFSNTGLKTIILPESLKYVADEAFSGCNSLKSVKFLSNPNHIEENAFYNCWELGKISFESKDKIYSYYNGKIEKAYDNKEKNISNTVNNDVFGKFVKKAIKEIKDYSVHNRESINDRINYDEDNKTLNITMAFAQYNKDDNLVSSRVECAEHLKNGDSVTIRTTFNGWEIFTEDGLSLGEFNNWATKQLLVFTNYISFVNSKIKDITPKSQRRSNAKYATGLIDFCIVAKDLSNYSKEDLNILDKIVYSLEENEAKLIHWIGKSSIKKAIIPSKIENKPVLTIPSFNEPDDSFFNQYGIGDSYENNPGFEELIIEEGIKRVEAGVLFYCQNMKKIVFPSSIEYISPNVFSSITNEEDEDDEYNYRDLYLNDKIIFVAPQGSYAEKFLKEYRPSSYGVKVLNVYSGNIDENSNDIKMLRGFNIIPVNNDVKLAFKQSYDLGDFKEKNVVLPSIINGNPLKIFDFQDIPNFVKKIVIPASVCEINYLNHHYSFYTSGKGLEMVEIDPNNEVYYSDGKAIYSKDKKTLIRFISTSTTNYEIIPGTVEISKYAFSYMENLKKIVIPISVVKIDDNAFNECHGLETIEGLDHDIELNGNIFGSGNSPFLSNTSVLIIGNTILRYWVYDKETIKIPDGIKRICHSAFGKFSSNKEDDSLVEIILPESIKIIEANAFVGRKKLKKINIPNGVEEISSGVFDKCEQLEEIYIPSSVSKICTNAFPNYKEAGPYLPETKCSFKTIIVDQNNKNYCSDNGMLLSKDRKQLLYIPYMKQHEEIIIPLGVESICDSLFLNNDSIVELELPDTIKSIGNGAFSGCKNLEKIKLPKYLETIGEYSFNGCQKLSNIIWPEKIRSIGDCSFSGTNIKSLKLPETIEHIGECAFAGIPIKNVTLPKSVRTLGWGAFSRVPEIEVYDTIDPNAKPADRGIDTINGHPNSLVGYIGMGPAWAMWECAANHRWANYTIIVKSADTDAIKYKVWMGADETQRDYYCFLSSGWGNNATFAFNYLDEFFPKIRGIDNKIKVAQYRLEYPYELSNENKEKYENYLKKNS